MATSNQPERHLKFYGLNDLATGLQAAEAAELLERFDSDQTEYTLTAIIELYNAKRYVEEGAFPASYSAADRDRLQQLLPAVQRAIGMFFSQLNDAKLADLEGPLYYDFHSDLLDLFVRNKVYSRTTTAVVLPLLDRLGLRLHDMLTSQKLVAFSDEELRSRLIADPAHAELLIRKHLEQDLRHNLYLPKSLTTADAGRLLNEYLEIDDPNLNFVKLVSLAHPKSEIGLDTRMKLKAKRRYDKSVGEYFANNTGMRTSCQVSFSPEQEEPVESSSVNGDTKFSYSQQWLEGNLDYPTILNNFIFLFEFVDTTAMLLLPSYLSEISALEGAMSVAARDAYKTGVVFRFKNQCSSMQVHMYLNFLRDHDIELESVIAWFFTTQTAAEFGAEGFTFTPSSSTSTYLERCRHLFSEMESIVKQFRLYVEDGQIDPELLSISSEAVQYKNIPSLLSGKYLYASDHQDIVAILHLLFSDQAGLGYISEELNARSAAALLARNRVAYDDFHAFQQAEVDYLIDRGVLLNTSDGIELANYQQLAVLKDLFDHEAASYYHYPTQARPIIDEMLQKGWLARESTLLSRAEASYLNYMLNQSEFSNGPDLRNKYLHGSQVNAGGEDEHFGVYVVVLKLLIALVIKLNDDLCLRHEEFG